MERTGLPSVASAIVAIVGMAAALYPRSAVLATLYAQAPALREALPVVLSVIGSVMAAVSHPPEWLRRPIVGALRYARGQVAAAARRLFAAARAARSPR